MPYTNHYGETICEARRLRTHYTKGNLPLDLVASFPIDFFVVAAPADKQLLVLSYLRMLHLLRLVRMSQFFADLAKRLDIE